MYLANETATTHLAETLADIARAGDVIALRGDLGTGKTAFARAFINYLTEHTEEVPSPTFTLVQLYESRKGVIYHFDMYRLEEPDDALELGVEDAFADGICLIEWPERLGPWLPRDCLELVIKTGPTEQSRRVDVASDSPHWNQRLATLPPWDTIEGIETDSPESD